MAQLPAWPSRPARGGTAIDCAGIHNSQQNSALVEQSAVAAENLKTQAAQLVEAVAVFHIGEDNAGTSKAPDSA